MTYLTSTCPQRNRLTHIYRIATHGSQDAGELQLSSSTEGAP